MYAIIEFRCHGDNVVVRRVKKLETAQRICSDPETSFSTCTTKAGKDKTAKYGPWFWGYSEV